MTNLLAGFNLFLECYKELVKMKIEKEEPEKEAREKFSEEDYKLAEEVIKPIYVNATKNDYSYAKYGVECYIAGAKAILEKWRNCYLSCSSPYCAFPDVEVKGKLGQLEKKVVEK